MPSAPLLARCVPSGVHFSFRQTYTERLWESRRDACRTLTNCESAVRYLSVAKHNIRTEAFDPVACCRQALGGGSQGNHFKTDGFKKRGTPVYEDVVARPEAAAEKVSQLEVRHYT